MKLKLFVFTIFFFSLSAVYAKVNFMVSVGYHHTCALDAEGVKCWGANGKGQTHVPPLKLPKQISAGYDHTCALDEDGVKCWGGGWDNKKVPFLKSPTQVSAGTYHNCAIDEDRDLVEVKCWGNNQYGQAQSRYLESPMQVSAAGVHTCALDKDGMHCWGSEFRYPEPILNSPTQVSAAERVTCALDADGVKCWEYVGTSWISLKVPSLKSPIQISAGEYRMCALDIEGVKCWRRSGRLEEVPMLNSPKQVSAGLFAHSCALDADGVKCWGLDEGGRLNAPEFVFDLVKKAISRMPFARAEFLKGLTKLAPEANSKAYYFEFLLASPTIFSMESPYFVDTYTPIFKKNMKDLQESFGYKGKILEVPDTEENRKLAIASIQSALSVSLSFLTPDSQTSIKDNLRAAGVAFAQPMDNQKIKELLKQLDALASEKKTLKSSPKSSFLVDSLELAAKWLSEKAK